MGVAQPGRMRNARNATGPTSMTWRRFWSTARRLAGVDAWEAERVAEIGLDADRRRDEHRADGAAAIARIKGAPGEAFIASIAALVEITESEVRSFLKAASAAGRAAAALTRQRRRKH